jgi:hypothetical protein
LFLFGCNERRFVASIYFENDWTLALCIAIEPRMNPALISSSSKPTPPQLAQYANLVGVSPEEFLNAFLQEFLVTRFSDPDIGEAEQFMLGFSFQERARAERLAAWIKERLTVPGSREYA